MVRTIEGDEVRQNISIRCPSTPTRPNTTSPAISISISPSARSGSLKLVGQPRAIVFHTKNGRQHCHVVWSRIYPDDSKAVQIDHDRYKLQPSYLLAGAQPLVPRRIPWFCPRTFSS